MAANYLRKAIFAETESLCAFMLNETENLHSPESASMWLGYLQPLKPINWYLSYFYAINGRKRLAIYWQRKKYSMATC